MAKGEDVQAMFAEIAPQYDLLNRVLSLGIDRGWRKRAVKRLALEPGARLLDLCCGTGDLALAFAEAGAVVTGADFAAPMLPLAREKARRRKLRIPWVQADAQCLPFADASFDAVTIAFGIRNVEDPGRALRECARVVRPGGRLGVLEFFRIPNRVWRSLFRVYFHGVLPVAARVTRAGRTGAYEYLPQSVDGFATPEQFHGWLAASGWEEVGDEALSGGVARLVTARHPVAQPVGAEEE